MTRNLNVANCPICGAELKVEANIIQGKYDDAIGLAGEILADEELKDTKVGRIGSRIVGLIGRILGR